MSASPPISPRIRIPALLFLPLLFSLLGLGRAAPADESTQPTPADLKKKLAQAILAGDDSAIAQVLRKAGTVPGRDMANAVLSSARALPPEFDSAYWLLLDGVSAFRHGDAFTEMGNYILRHKTDAIAYDLMNALRKSQSVYLGRVIRQLLEEGTEQLQLMAIDLAPNAKVRRTVDILMPYLEREYAKEEGGEKPPTEMKIRLIFALEALTLQNLGNSVPNWVGWWQRNRHLGLKVIRDQAVEKEPTTGLARPLDPIRQRQFLGLEDMPPGKVLVIRAGKDKRGWAPNYDKIEDVLERLGIKHDIATRAEVEEPKYSLAKYDAIFINCCQINEYCQNPDHEGGEEVGNRLRRCLGPGAHDEVCFKFTEPGRKKIQEWTEKGGYLFTEDWVLIDLLSLVWSSYVGPGSAQGGDWQHIKGQTVDIRPARGFTAHPFLRAVFVPPPKIDWDIEEPTAEDDDLAEVAYDPTVEDDPGDVDVSSGTSVDPAAPVDATVEIPEPEIDLVKHEWKIDDESPTLDVKSKKVEVLIVSSKLEKEYGHSAVAVTFPVKEGRVLHVVSHFGKQSSSHNEATLENILINFLLEVNVRSSRK